MGSPVTELGHRPDERQVEVTLSRGFWLSKFEITQSQWHRTATEPTERPLATEFGLGDDFPVY